MSDSFATTWSVPRQPPLSMEFPRQEYWSALPFPSPEDLLNPGIEPRSPALAGTSFTTEPQGSPCCVFSLLLILCDHIFRASWKVKFFGFEYINAFFFLKIICKLYGVGEGKRKKG